MNFDDIVVIDERSEKGAWVDNLRNLNGVAFKVRAEMNSDHERIFSELWAKLPADKRDDPELTEAIDKECIERAILLDWRGIDGFPCDPENVRKALEVRTFRQAIVQASRTVASRGRETLETDAKN